MCLLTYIPEGVQPNIEALREGARSNRDGHGFAIVVPEKRRIIIEKSMDAEELLAKFAELRGIHASGPALFHSRLTTDGMTGISNNHPFPIARDDRTVMAHNGVFTQARPKKGDLRSDTRIVADSFARHFKLRSAKGRRRFGSWMGDYNKVVILTVDPSFDKNGYIVNEGRGVWDKGIWYSNTSYVPWTPRVSHGSNWTYYGAHRGGSSSGLRPKGVWWKNEQGAWVWEATQVNGGESDWLDCPVCEKTHCVSRTVFRCYLCRSCSMCYNAEDDCLCWLEDMKDTRSDDIDRLLDEFEQEEAAKGRELVPLGATVSSALQQAHEWARHNHTTGCRCEWCVLDFSYVN